MVRRKEKDGLACLTQTAEGACRAARLLYSALEDFEPARLPEHLREGQQIVHAVDNGRREAVNGLLHAFITPVEREDILRLAGELGEVTVQAVEALSGFHSLAVWSVREEALPLAAAVRGGCESLLRAMEAFPNFRKSPKAVLKETEEARRQQREGGALYERAVRRLFQTSGDPSARSVWQELYGRIREAGDACGRVACTAEYVIIKNT
ncbi:MAG: hypothetical protein HFJ80_07025 [Clostridiales bacterium]|nr:hypothetical protein [Clostridiales bacterium]